MQARLLGVHFYVEARTWPAEFVLEHERKIAIFTDSGCPPSTLPQRGGSPYLREHFLFWMPDWRLGIAMVDPPQPGVLPRLRLFIREFLPLLRHFRTEPGLLIVTADKTRCHIYERLLKRHRSIHKLGLGVLIDRIKPYCVRPAVPTITDVTWPKADKDDCFIEFGQDSHSVTQSDTSQKQVCELIQD